MNLVSFLLLSPYKKWLYREENSENEEYVDKRVRAEIEDGAIGINLL